MVANSNAYPTDFDTDQLKGVIFGLLRQNSYSFLEALEEASGQAIKSILREVVHSFTGAHEGTATALVGEYAKRATNEEWIDLFDVILGWITICQTENLSPKRSFSFSRIADSLVATDTRRAHDHRKRH